MSRHFVGERFGTRVLTGKVSTPKWTRWCWACDCGATGGPGEASKLASFRCARCTPGPRNRPLTLNGETKAIAAWARDLGLSRQAVHQRMQDGWDWQEALSAPRTPGTNLPEKRRRGAA